MHILYDFQTFESQQFGGISRYFYELWRHAIQAGFSADIACRYGKNAYLREVNEFQANIRPFDDPWRVFLERFNIPGQHQILRGKYRVFSKKSWKTALRTKNRQAILERLNTAPPDIFHPTYYDAYFLETLKDRPFVLTVFDMIFERFPEYYPLTNHTSKHKHQLCQAAHRIIAISEQTKRDLVHIFQIAPEKIEVIYLGNSLRPLPEAPQSLDTTHIPPKYILFTGSRKRYKNFYFFLRAIADMLHADRTLHLVCTGETLLQEEHAFVTMLGIQPGQVRHIQADDVMLAYLYQHALAFVFPSLYEGFGIPILEAFACGCPAILSNTSSLPEIAGDAAVYFDPKEIHSIREAVLHVITHEHVRADLIARGYERVKLFSWEDTARKTSAIYKQIIEDGREHSNSPQPPGQKGV